ncbi:tetracycline resistance MFS efflux pump [Bacillus pseudomycoides]|nr:tetracycline resistance MFS efflux pump [Bacillus pseudomycoides]
MVFNVVLPDIAKDLGISPSLANWVKTSFMISFAIGSITYGTMSDKYGVKKLFLFGLLVYSAGSLLGVLAHSHFFVVIVARFIQGVGASAVPALIMVIVARYVKSEDRGKAFGVIGSLVAMGEGIGPVLGGTVAHYVQWPFLFLIPTLTLFAIPFFLKELPNESTKGKRVDIFGIALLSCGIVIFTINTTQNNWLYLAISCALFAGFILHIHKVEQPFIELRLLMNQKFILGVLTGCVPLGTVAGCIAMIPYMMRGVHQLSASKIGWVIFPGTMSVMVFGTVGGSLVDKRGTTFVLWLGSFFILASFFILSLFADQTLWLVSGMLILMFGGLSFVKTVISTSVAAVLDPKEVGAGMGFLSFACFLAEGLGIAIVGGLLTKHMLEYPLLSTIQNAKAYLYRNLFLVFIVTVLIGATIYTVAYSRRNEL